MNRQKRMRLAMQQRQKPAAAITQETLREFAKSSCNSCYGTGVMGYEMRVVNGVSQRHGLGCPCVAKAMRESKQLKQYVTK